MAIRMDILREGTKLILGTMATAGATTIIDAQCAQALSTVDGRLKRMCCIVGIAGLAGAAGDVSASHISKEVDQIFNAMEAAREAYKAATQNAAEKPEWQEQSIDPESFVY